MKVVYITGCLGFIGSHLTRKVLQLGWHVRGVDKITYAANRSVLSEFIKYPNFRFEETDINDLEFLYDCDYVINLAAETHVDNSIISSNKFIHSNINGVHNLLELLRKSNNFKMPTLLHFSTDEVYGDIKIGKHVETDILKPSNPYSATKAAADMLILAWARTYKVPYIIVRPTNNYGIGQHTEKLIPKACKFLRMDKKIPLHEKGLPIRTWLNVKDTADAIITIINSGVSNEIYNIAGNLEQSNIITVEQILREYLNISEHVSIDFEKYVDFSATRSGQDIRYSIDDSKLHRLGWNQKCLFVTELREIVKYYKENFVW